MKMLAAVLTLAVGLGLVMAGESGSARAAEWHHFSNPAKEQRYQTLLGNLRCLVCQDESLAESSASLAADLRAEVYQMMKNGESNAEIKQYLVNRYGDYVLYKPPLDYRTYALWFGPFALVALGGVILVVSIRRRSHEPVAEISPEERARLEELLGGRERNRK